MHIAIKHITSKKVETEHTLSSLACAKAEVVQKPPSFARDSSCNMFRMCFMPCKPVIAKNMLTLDVVDFFFFTFNTNHNDLRSWLNAQIHRESIQTCSGVNTLNKEN